MSTHPSYRPDVDGLRAIAVLSVIGFHAFPSAVHGGFVGVDIFFVISGYLISSIILKSLDRGKFDFWDFYSRRIRRIFPALVVVLLACLAFGWYVLLADEFQQLGKHTAGGAAFVSNVVLWREVEYFDTAAELKPLLHLWSLGIEEQFYIVWPLLVFVAWRFRPLVPALILAIVAGSFVLNVLTVGAHPAAAFFLPATRFWELLSGGLLAYLGLLRDDPEFIAGAFPRIRASLRRVAQARYARRLQDLVSCFGGALLIFAIFGINKESAFPGWWASIPTAGALLTIAAGERAWFNRAVLARGALVFIGLISYPLYLWHWPLLSYARIVGHTEVIPVLVVVSALLAWATYRFVELPMRRPSGGPRRAQRVAPALFAAMVVLALVGLGAWRSLLPGRLDAVSRDLASARHDWAFPGHDVLIPGSGAGTVLFLGDSYMEQYYPRVNELSKSDRWAKKTLAFRTSAGCTPLAGIERRSHACQESVLKEFAFAGRDEVDTIVIGASWFGFLERGDYFRAGDPSRASLDLRAPDSDWVYALFEKQLAAWVQRKKRVYIVLSHPGGLEADPAGMIADRLAWHPSVSHRTLSLAEHLKKTGFIHDRLRRLANAAGATVIDPAEWLCHGETCPTESEAGAPIYMDSTHLRASFVRTEIHFLDAVVQGDSAAAHPRP